MHWSIPVHSLLGISQSFAHTLGASLNPPYGSSLTWGREGKFTCTRCCPAFILIEYPGAFDQLFNIYPPTTPGSFLWDWSGREGEGFGHYENGSMRKIKGKKELTFVNASVKCFRWRVLLKIQYLPPLLTPLPPTCRPHCRTYMYRSKWLQFFQWFEKSHFIQIEKYKHRKSWR